MFCAECGRNIGDAEICPYCHHQNKSIEKAAYSFTPPENDAAPGSAGGKSRITAGLLQLFTGILGIGRFYLGYTAIGVLQVIVSVITCGLGGLIWGVVDGIMILSGQVKRDGKGNEMTA